MEQDLLPLSQNMIYPGGHFLYEGAYMYSWND
jgi:hypothetical protein